MNMIAIGGAIGTGLFVASGGALSEAGPGGALLAYGVIGIMVFFLMQSLGEMATYMPVSGSFSTYASRFVSPSFGFAMGWNYWYNWAITVAAELVAAAIVMQYWLPGVDGWVWSLVFISLLFGLNYLSTRAFGEGEFWFASIKVVTIIIFLAVGVLMIFGILGGTSPGFANWTTGDAPFAGGIGPVISIFMVAGFSFQGTELVGIAAGESQDPEKNVPRAIKSVFWRILLFYIGAIAVLGFLIPYTDDRLLQGSEENIAMAPFTLVFERAGLAAAAAVMNAVILTSILSAGNSGLYASTRMLYALARDNKAPQFFSYVNRRGVPIYALIATTAVGGMAFVTTLVGEGKAYEWLYSASGLAGFIAWFGIAWSHRNFRRAFLAQGHSLNELPFRARFFPIAPILAMILCSVVIIGQGESLIEDFSWKDLIMYYLGLPFFLSLWFGHKLATGSRPVPPDQADLSREMLPIVDDEPETFVAR